jgi:iron(III) transport system substrate-binding protein
MVKRSGWLGRLVAILAVFAMIAAACGGDDDSSEGFEALDRDDLLQKAIDEGGELIVYSEATEAKNNLLIDAFRAKYPEIDVQYVRLTPSDLNPRFEAENAADATVASVVQGTSADFQAQMVDAGNFTKLTEDLIPVLGEGFPSDFLRPETGNAVNSITLWGICINTDIISPADAPTEFADLADPKYAGEILLADPNVAAVYYGFWDTLVDEVGEDVVRGIAANVKQVFPSGVPATQAVGAGEGGVELVCVPTLATLVSNEGAPVEYIQPSLTSTFEHRPSLVADAPHPYKARLWIDFSLSREGIAAWAQLDASPWEADQIPASAKVPALDYIDRQDSLNDILGIAGG